jgi:hypothetical protein
MREYYAHCPFSSLIATIQARKDDEYLICWYGGKNHGKINIEIGMNSVISALAERLAEYFPHHISAKNFESGECFEYFRLADGKMFKLCVFGERMGNYELCH